MDEQFRIGIQRRVYNATLKDAITRTGKSVQVVAGELGIGYQRLLDWIRFKSYPTDDDLRLRVAIYFSISDDILFPEEIAGVRLTKQPTDLRLSYADFREQASSWLLQEQPSVEQIAEQGELTRLVQEALDKLTEREKAVVTLRYGLGGEVALTLSATAERQGVTMERVRQIESKALRKLRVPIRSVPLGMFMGYQALPPVEKLPTVKETIAALYKDDA